MKGGRAEKMDGCEWRGRKDEEEDEIGRPREIRLFSSSEKYSKGENFEEEKHGVKLAEAA